MKIILWSLTAAGALMAAELSAQPYIQPVLTNAFSEPYGVAVDAANNYYVTDSAHDRIMRYNPSSGALTNLAGQFNNPGTDDGPGVFARFFSPQGIVYARGGLVVADTGNNRIRFVALDGAVSTLAGSSAGTNDAVGTAARFNAPSGVAADAAGDIYVADTLNNSIRKIDLSNNVTTIATGLHKPTAVAVDESGQVYVADTETHSIRVIATNGVVSLLAGSGSAAAFGDYDNLVATNALFDGPRGVLWVGGTTGLLVSDTGNHKLRRVYFNSALNIYSVETYGSTTDIPLVSPTGLAVDNDGNIPVADLGNNDLFLVQVTAPQAPVKDPTIGIVNFTTNAPPATVLSAVTNATFNNDVKVAILAEKGVNTYYTLDSNVDLQTDPGAGSTPAPYSNGLSDWNNSLINPELDGSDVTIRAISVQQGRHPSAVVRAHFVFKVANPIINGNNPGGFTMEDQTTNAELWYTTDGSTPTNHAPSQLYKPSSSLYIVNGTNNVLFKVRAFRDGYLPSEEMDKTFLFTDLQTSSIGLTRDFDAGIGSTIVVPVEVKLATGQALQSLQFRIEVTPNGGAPALSSSLRFLQITTNDFIQLPVPNTNAPTLEPYTMGNTNGLAIAYLDQGSGLDISGSATVALVAVPIPTTSTVGQSYTIALVQPSGTSDGIQTPVDLVPFANRTILITNLSYVVGDSAVANWYNAGDFGNGNLNNNDVNNAFLASLGLFVPYSFSDVFDAMDSFPKDTSTAVGGDGQIRYLDWQVIFNRSLRLKGNNWKRSWTTGGFRSQASATLNTSPDLPAANPDGSLHGSFVQADALVGATSQGDVAPGSEAQVPMFVSLTPGKSLDGLQFRAVVSPENGAPPLGQVPVFIPAAQFATNLMVPPPLPSGQVAAAWPLGSFGSSLTGSNFLGVVQFTVPASAKAGQGYAINVANADGAPNLQTQYDFIAQNAAVAVGTNALPPVATSTNGFRLTWYGAAGQHYSVEASTNLKDWTPLSSGLVGRGTQLQYKDATDQGQTRFYRVVPQP